MLLDDTVKLITDISNLLHIGKVNNLNIKTSEHKVDIATQNISTMDAQVNDGGARDENPQCRSHPRKNFNYFRQK